MYMNVSVGEHQRRGVGVNQSSSTRAWRSMRRRISPPAQNSRRRYTRWASCVRGHGNGHGNDHGHGYNATPDADADTDADTEPRRDPSAGRDGRCVRRRPRTLALKEHTRRAMKGVWSWARMSRSRLTAWRAAEGGGSTQPAASLCRNSNKNLRAEQERDRALCGDTLPTAFVRRKGSWSMWSDSECGYGHAGGRVARVVGGLGLDTGRQQGARASSCPSAASLLLSRHFRANVSPARRRERPRERQLRSVVPSVPNTESRDVAACLA